jgi:hypothetical protein
MPKEKYDDHGTIGLEIYIAVGTASRIKRFNYSLTAETPWHSQCSSYCDDDAQYSGICRSEEVYKQYSTSA